MTFDSVLLLLPPNSLLFLNSDCVLTNWASKNENVKEFLDRISIGSGGTEQYQISDPSSIVAVVVVSRLSGFYQQLSGFDQETMEASKLNDGGDESSVLQKSESLPVTSSQFRSPNRFLQFIQNILIILNCLLIISIFGMSQQMIRYQSIIGFSIFHFGSIIIIAFALSINIILKLFEGIIDKSNYFRILINTISIILSVLIASNIKYQWIPINSNNVADEVRTNFLKILESNNDLTLLHQFQNEFQCCGVRLADDPTFVWNQTTIALSNPWSFWFYTFVPGDQYIFDVRRLFSLPWSCCRNMMRCEHLGIERFSLQFPDSIASSSSVFDEVESIDRLLGTRIISDVVTSIYEPSCQEKGREIVDGSMRILMIQLYVQAAFSTFFAFTNLLFKFGV